MSARRPTLKLRFGDRKEPEAMTALPPEIEHAASESGAESVSNPRKRPPRMMPYSAKEHPEHEGAVSLMRSASVATDWEWAQLWQKHPEKMLHGLQTWLAHKLSQQQGEARDKEGA